MVSWILSSAAVSFARADVVQPAGQSPEVGVKLTGLREGRLYYMSHVDHEVFLPLEQIAYLQVTGWTPFNEAEKQQRADHHREAVRWYQRAMDRPFRRVGGRLLKTDSAGDGIDYELLARCRLLRSLDKLGQWDLAVEQYLRIIERMLEGVESLRPANVTPSDAEVIARALSLIDEAVGRHGRDTLAKSLIEWSNGWGGRKRQTESEPAPPESLPHSAPPPAKEIIPPALADSTQLESLVAQKRFAEALAMTDALLAKGGGSDQGSLYYWRGRAWHGQSMSEKSPQSEEDRRRAGLAFMRVVILYPDHERAAESLFLAARIRREDGHHGQADQMLRELVTRYPQAQPWLGQAEKILSAARAGDSAPVP